MKDTSKILGWLVAYKRRGMTEWQGVLPDVFDSREFAREIIRGFSLPEIGVRSCQVYKVIPIRV